MKPTINKSRLMKEAHRLRMYEKLEMSVALKLAWIAEKKKIKAETDAYLWSLPSTDYVEPTEQELYSSMASWNHNYYRNNRYTLD